MRLALFRSSLMLGVGTAVALTIGGCADEDQSAPAQPSGADGAGQSATSSASTEPTVWTGITDGTWEWGDVGFNESLGAPSQQYTVAVTGPPTLTEYNGRTVRMTSPLAVVHVKAEGFGGPVPEAANVFFSPGPGDTANAMNEAYGTQTEILCDDDEPIVGAGTTCTVSFVADIAGVQDSTWQVMGEKVAAWPSQKP